MHATLERERSGAQSMVACHPARFHGCFYTGYSACALLRSPLHVLTFSHGVNRHGDFNSVDWKHPLAKRAPFPLITSVQLLLLERKSFLDHPRTSLLLCTGTTLIEKLAPSICFGYGNGNGDILR
jgi:hypothetical protein